MGGGDEGVGGWERRRGGGLGAGPDRWRRGGWWVGGVGWEEEPIGSISVDGLFCGLCWHRFGNSIRRHDEP